MKPVRNSEVDIASLANNVANHQGVDSPVATAKTSTFDSTQLISSSQRGIFAVRTNPPKGQWPYREGCLFYIEDPYFNKEAKQKIFSILALPLGTSTPKFAFADRYFTQQCTSFHICSLNQVQEIWGESDKGVLYSKCFGLLGKKEGAPLVFFSQDSSLENQGSKDIENQKKPFKQLLNRTYLWTSNEGNLLFFEYKDGTPIWKIYTTDGKTVIPELVEFRDGKFVFPKKKYYVPVLDPLRLESISPDKKKVVFRIEEQKGSVDGKSLVSPAQWNLTMIIDGPAELSGGIKFNKLHARVYLQTPASPNVIEIHLTLRDGLLAREFPQAEIEKRVQRRGQVVDIYPSSKFIEKIFKDFARKIRLGKEFANCSEYCVALFQYAGKPFAENSLNPFDSSWNPLAFTRTFSNSSSEKDAAPVHEMQKWRKLARCTQGKTTLAVYELQNGINYDYYVFSTNRKLLYREKSGFEHTVTSFQTDSKGFHLTLHRTGLFSFLSFFEKNIFIPNQQGGE